MSEIATPTHSRRARIVVVLLACFVPAAVAGPYLDWVLWPVYAGLMITLAAITILLAGAVLWVVGRMIDRRWVRLTAVAGLAVAVGLLAGQNLGRSREPLLQRFDGTMTLALDAPVSAMATGPASCTSVASGMEFSVTGDPNMRLETPDLPFVMVYANAGDRWEVSDSAPRKDGVRLDIELTDVAVPADGKPSPVWMVATPSSTLAVEFDSEGGSISFAGLAPLDEGARAGDVAEFSGRLQWTCGKPLE